MQKRAIRNLILGFLFFLIIFLLIFAIIYFVRNNGVQLSPQSFQGKGNFTLVGAVTKSDVGMTLHEKGEKRLDINKPIYGLSVTGNVIFNSEDSVVRIVLVDNHGKEYLVYEEYPLISDSEVFENHCDETCALDAIVPLKIKIQVKDAAVTIDGVNYIDSDQKEDSRVKQKGVVQFKRERKQAQEKSKVDEINQKIREKGLQWVAGETSVSNLSYEEKKRLFAYENGSLPEFLPNLQGFEYYKGGIFELGSDATQSSSPTADNVAMSPPTSSLPSSWDWRDVSGENWNTPVKDQGGAGTCWAHAMIGAVESQANIYYNQHLNLDLSEQQLVDCISEDKSTIGFMYNLSQCPQDIFYFDKCLEAKHGFADERCDPYVQRDLTYDHCNLNYVCSNWADRSWKFNYSYDFGLSPGSGPTTFSDLRVLSEEEIKKNLVAAGPLESGVSPMGHAMVLEGYDSSSRTIWNWSVTNCGSLNCDQKKGCFNINDKNSSAQCNNSTAGNKISLCNNVIDLSLDYVLESSIADYTCMLNKEGQGSWVFNDKSLIKCASGQVCSDNRCVNATVLKTGDLFCENGFGGKLLRYSPGAEEAIVWIFKNSWGTSWGENGYGRLSFPVGNLGISEFTLLTGPFVPPKNKSYWPVGFTNTIRCVDKDNDGYCNWGISDAGLNSTWRNLNCPASCKVNSEKDCDDSNNKFGGFDSNYNCKAITTTCVPNWDCSAWGSCVNGQQTRTCTDSNNCGQSNPTTQSCSSPRVQVCPANALLQRGLNNQQFSCSCTSSQTASGSVWGTGIYTDDSTLCRAAVHAGKITTAGGTITYTILPGQSSYTGSTQNNVVSSSYNTWAGSYSFGTTGSAVNGVCGAGNNLCTAGRLNDINDSATNYLWQCLGSGGGTNAGCSIAKSITTYLLSVGNSVGGIVTSSPIGINCGSTCSASYNSGTSVALTATANSGSTFSGWTGACSGTGSCVVAMNSAKSVNAMFNVTQNSTQNCVSNPSGTITGSVKLCTGVYSSALTVGNGAVLDCNGAKMKNTITMLSNAVLKNCIVNVSAGSGAYVSGALNVSLLNNQFNQGSGFAINVANSNLILNANTIRSGGYSIYCSNSNVTSISNSILSGTLYKAGCTGI